MILAIECIVSCIVFTLIILPAQYKDPMVMIMSYPPNVIKRVEQLPQCAGCMKEREKKHISKKIFKGNCYWNSSSNTIMPSGKDNYGRTMSMRHV